MSTFLGYLMPKLFPLEEHLWYNVTHTSDYKMVYTFTKDIYPEVNLIERE